MEPRESKENWRWKVPKSPTHPEDHQKQAGYPPQGQGYPYSHSQEAEPAVSYGEEGDYYAHLSQRTEVLSSHGGGGATVLLGPETKPPAHPHSARTYLELNEPNAAATQRIELTNPILSSADPLMSHNLLLRVWELRGHMSSSRVKVENTY